MAVLNALRAVAWWLVSVRLMHKDPWQNALTRLGDFAMLMVLHCAYEARTRIMYKRACNKEQQQNALISPGLASQGTSCDSARAAPGPPQSAPQAMARLKSFETDLNGGSHFTAAANFSDGVFSASLSPRMEVDTSERSLLTTISSVNETVARIKVPYIRKPRNQEGQVGQESAASLPCMDKTAYISICRPASCKPMQHGKPASRALGRRTCIDVQARCGFVSSA